MLPVPIASSLVAIRCGVGTTSRVRARTLVSAIVCARCCRGSGRRVPVRGCLGRTLVPALVSARCRGRRRSSGTRGGSLVPTLLQADLHILRNVDGKVLAELFKVRSIDGRRESKRGVDDVDVETKEVLSDLRDSGVLVVESGNKDGGLALVVDLVVDATLRENSALELGESSGNLGTRVRCFDEAVLENIAEVNLSVHDGEELGGTRVDVRSVDAASVQKSERGRDA